MGFLLPFVLFAGFLVYLWWQARHGGLTRPGWWKPLVAWAALLTAAFIVAASWNGFEPGALIVIPFVAVWVGSILALVERRRSQ
jgi:hypothetical protein